MDWCRPWHQPFYKLFCRLASPDWESLSNSSVPPPSSATVLQIQSTEHSIELAASQFNALFSFVGNWQLKDANFKSLVPNTKTVGVPKQNLDPVTRTIEEQK
jgi:hypothetical protein